MVFKESNLDFIFVEDEFLDSAGSALHLKNLGIKTPWVIEMCSNEPNDPRDYDTVCFYKSITRPLIQIYFEGLLS